MRGSLTTAQSSPQDPDVARVGDWLSCELPEVELPIKIALIAGGRSNLTYEVLDARGRSLALRRPPFRQLHKTAHDMEREFDILSALRDQAVPVPEPLAYCADPDILGAPFLVMQFAGGETVSRPDDAEFLSQPARQQLGETLIDVLVNLHDVDIDAVGLTSLRRPGGVIERQLRRWSRQIDSYTTITTPLLRSVHATLENRVPEPQRTALLHGDYKLENLRVDARGDIVAVLDWELATVGDPLVDLGWLLASWTQPGDTRRWIVTPPTFAGGFAGPATLTARYEEASGLRLSELNYYIAFAYWRWSCINEGILARVQSGAMGEAKRIDPEAAREQIRWQMAESERLLAASPSVDQSAASESGS